MNANDKVRDEHEKQVAALACEFFERTRDGEELDVNDYIKQLPKPEYEKMFLASVNMSFLVLSALRAAPIPEHTGLTN